MKWIAYKMMIPTKVVCPSLDMSECTKSYSDALDAPLSPGHESLETEVSNDSLVSVPQRITHNLLCILPYLRLSKGLLSVSS